MNQLTEHGFEWSGIPYDKTVALGHSSTRKIKIIFCFRDKTSCRYLASLCPAVLDGRQWSRFKVMPAVRAALPNASSVQMKSRSGSRPDSCWMESDQVGAGGCRRL